MTGISRSGNFEGVPSRHLETDLASVHTKSPARLTAELFGVRTTGEIRTRDLSPSQGKALSAELQRYVWRNIKLAQRKDALRFIDCV